MAEKAIKGGKVTLPLSSPCSAPSYSHVPSHNPLVLRVPLVCKLLLRSQPEELRNTGARRGRAWHGSQVIVTGGSESFTRNISAFPVQRQHTRHFSRGPCVEHCILLYPSVHISDTRHFLCSWMNLDMQT